jgi:hypothetical protein
MILCSPGEPDSLGETADGKLSNVGGILEHPILLKIRNVSP